MLRALPIGGARETCMSQQPPPTNAKEPEPRGDADRGGIAKATVARRSLTGLRIALAMLVAVGADTVLAPVAEAIAIFADLAVAVVLTLILGWSWPLAAALVLECIPGVGLFPSWVLAVTGIAIVGRGRKPQQQQPAGK